MPDELESAPRVARRDALRASPPMFRSGTLDSLTRIHPAVPAVLYLPPIAVLMSLSFEAASIAAVAAAVAAGYVLWTLCEYWVHRIVFHYEPQAGFGARLHWMVHGVHHDHPSDPRRLVLPPVVSVPFAFLFYALFDVTVGEPLSWAVTSGFFAGYLGYDMVHFALHRRRPTSRLGRHLHELHMRHHFEDDRRGFGVSAPWWDVVFGTTSRRRGERRASPRR